MNAQPVSNVQAWLRRLACGLALVSLVGAAHTAEITVVQISAFSGKLATASRDYNLGLHACLADYNAQAAPNAHRFRLVSRDDAFSPDMTAARTAEVLRERRPTIFVGFTGSRNILAAMDAGISQASIPVLGVRSASSELHKLPGLFHLRPAQTVEVDILTSQVATLGLQRLAIVVSDDAYGAEATASAEAAAARHNLRIVGVSRYAARAVDLGDAAKAANAASPQAVLLVADTQASADFVKRFREVNRSALVVAVSDTEGEVLSSLIGPELARGVGVSQVTPDPRRGSRAISRDFGALMQRLNVPADRISHGSMGGYIACQVLLRAAAKLGADVSPAAMTAALEALATVDLGGFTVGFGPRKRDGSRYVDLSVIDDRGALRQ